MTTVGSRHCVSLSLVVVAVLLTASAGFCLFDTGGDEQDAVGFDLCGGMLAVALGGVVFVSLGMVGRAPEQLRWAATPVAVPILDPPPWR